MQSENGSPPEDRPPLVSCLYDRRSHQAASGLKNVSAAGNWRTGPTQNWRQPRKLNPACPCFKRMPNRSARLAKTGGSPGNRTPRSPRCKRGVLPLLRETHDGANKKQNGPEVPANPGPGILRNGVRIYGWPREVLLTRAGVPSGVAPAGIAFVNWTR